MSSSADLCHYFANLIADTRYDNLSNAAVEAAKKSILDTLGVTLAASGMEAAVGGLVKLVRNNGGRPESSVLGFGYRVPAAMAAFANGAMAHCLDFDDRTQWGSHASSSLVPAAFAVAERQGGVSGRRMIAAVAAGQDIFVRLRCNVKWSQDWNLSTVLGVYSAAAAASHVMGLSREQAGHALGLASMQSAGTGELMFGTGSDLRGMYAGFTAKGAVLAAQLAHEGITGIEGLFEGKAGIINGYFGGEYDRDGMLRDLGKEYLGETMLYKPWPAVGVSHTYIHATIELMKRHQLGFDDIEQIRLYVGDFHQRMCAPLESRRAPATAVEAKFSLPFCVAIAAVRGEMNITDFTPVALKDPRVLAMAQKVVPVEDSSRDWNTAPPDGRIEILTRDGRTFEGVGHDVPGNVNSPLSWDDLARKFYGCAMAAATPVRAEQIAQAQDMAMRLETLEDATQLLRVLC